MAAWLYGVMPAKMACKRARKPVGTKKLAKRSKLPSTTRKTARQPPGRRPRPDVLHSSLYRSRTCLVLVRDHFARAEGMWRGRRFLSAACRSAAMETYDARRLGPVN